MLINTVLTNSQHMVYYNATILLIMVCIFHYIVIIVCSFLNLVITWSFSHCLVIIDQTSQAFQSTMFIVAAESTYYSFKTNYFLKGYYDGDTLSQSLTRFSKYLNLFHLIHFTVILMIEFDTHVSFHDREVKSNMPYFWSV